MPPPPAVASHLDGTNKKPSSSAEPPPLSPQQVWGTLIDPDGDCRLTLDERRHAATFEVPGSPHLLSADLRIPTMNAPRTLRPVSGDFLARVHVTGTEKVGGRTTVREYTPYHGAGLLVWQDPANYVRLEIASAFERSRTRHYANFEYRQNAKLKTSLGSASESGSGHLRLERKGSVITASFGPDRVKWVSFSGLTVSLAADVQIGLVAINSATRPLVAQLDEFQVTTTPKSEGDSVP
jgi:hypothetical protein